MYVSGRLEYGQSKREDGSTKDITIILSGKFSFDECMKVRTAEGKGAFSN